MNTGGRGSINMDISGITGLQGVGPAKEAEERATSNALDMLQRMKDAASIAADEKQLSELDKQSREIESLFIYMLLKEMRKTVPEQKLIHGGKAEEIFRDMMDEEMSRKMAFTPGPGLGIAKMLYEELSRSIIGKAGGPEKDLTGEE